MAPPSAPIPAPFSLVDNGVEQPELAAITSIADKMISPFLPFILAPFLLDPIPDSCVDLRIALRDPIMIWKKTTQGAYRIFPMPRRPRIKKAKNLFAI